MSLSCLCCHRFGDYPEADQNSYLNDCSSTSMGSNEDCYQYSFYTTTLYVAVNAYKGYSDLTITCTQDVGSDYDDDYWGVGLNQPGNSMDGGDGASDDNVGTKETSQSFCANKAAAVVGAGFVAAWMLVMM